MLPSQLSVIDLLLQFSEESGELLQALSKYVRKQRGLNPTPVTLEECQQSLVEEIADVSVTLNVLIDKLDIPPDELERIVQSKKARWKERLSQ